MRLLFATISAAAALAIAPALALAAPPGNDAYLASVPIVPAVDPVVVNTDTTEATTQPDLFNPNASGQPLGGGEPEPTTCKGVSFGKTVWYDFAQRASYGVQLRAFGGFPTVIAVYEWSPGNSRIRRLVDCSASAGTEDLLMTLEGRKSYTFQIGGVGGAGGPLQVRMEAFRDTDSDGEYDGLDKCEDVPGISRFGGCPPELRAVPSVNFDRVAGGLRLTRLVVDRVPQGARVVARCSGCGSQTVTARRGGRITFNRLVGRTARTGGSIEVRVTKRRSGNGTYRFGATGSYFRWPVTASGLGRREMRCLNVRTDRIERCR